MFVPPPTQVDAPQLYLDLVLMGAKTFHKTSSSVLGVNDLDGEWAMGEAYNTKDASEIVKAGGRFLCRLRAVSEEKWLALGTYIHTYTPTITSYACMRTYLHTPTPTHFQPSPTSQDADPIPAPIVPVHTSLDPNVNGIVEIVRCPVPDGGRDGVLDVVFLLQDAPVVPQPASGGDGKQQQGQKGQGQKGQSPEPYDLVRVNVPRATRTAGYFNYTCVWVGLLAMDGCTSYHATRWSRVHTHTPHHTPTHTTPPTASTPRASTPGRPSPTGSTSASPGSPGAIPARSWTWCWSSRSTICRYARVCLGL